MTYIIQPDGSLGIFRPSSFDFIYSVDVFEHIERNSVEKEIKEIYRILKPGGVTAHQIGLDDHLTHYAVGMPSKNYLRYPTKEWKLFFENRLQYINRVQLPEFYYYFKTAGFIEVKSDIEYDDSLLKKISPSVEFRKFSDSDLKAIRGSLVFRKPG
jgi:SAM-dependent methyltransferase